MSRPPRRRLGQHSPRKTTVLSAICIIAALIAAGASAYIIWRQVLKGKQNASADAALQQLISAPLDEDAVAARLRTGLQLLQRDVLSFWLAHGPDQEYGGFHGALDRRGHPVTPDPTKTLKQQSRHLLAMVEAYAAIQSSAAGSQEPAWDPLAPVTSSSYAALSDMLPGVKAAAADLYKFINSYMVSNITWATHNEVTRAGKPLAANDRTVVWSFTTISAFVRYGAVFSDPQAVATALKLWQSLDQWAWDPENLGYDETQSNPPNRPFAKSSSCHVKALEALLELWRAGAAHQEPLLTTRLQQVSQLFLTQMVNPTTQLVGQDFYRSWQHAGNTSSVEYGQNMISAFQLADAAQAMHMLNSQESSTSAQLQLSAQLTAAAAAMTKAAMKQGLDPVARAMHSASAPDGRRPSLTPGREFQWWYQTESMKALWRSFTSTGDPSLLAATSLLLDVVEGRLRDWVHGELLYEVVWTGEGQLVVPEAVGISGQETAPGDGKSNAWKDSYYTVTLAFQLDAAIAQWQAGRAQAASAPVGSPPGTQIQGHRRLQPLDITPAHPKGTGPGSHEGALLQQQGHSYASAMLNTRAAAAEALGGPYAVLQPGGSGSLSGTLATLTALYSSVLGWLKAVSPTPTPDVSYSSGTQGSNAGAAAAWAPVGLGPTLAAPLPPVSLAACLASSGARLLYPYSAAFEVQVVGDNLRTLSVPLAIAYAGSAAQVSAVIACAREAGVPYVPRGGGHSYEGLSVQSAAVVIDTSPMVSFSLSSPAPGSSAPSASSPSADGSGRAVLSVGAGWRLGALATAISEAAPGWALPMGLCPGVGVAGLTLGGGHGLLSRKFGLTSDSLLAAQVVLTNGTVVDAAPTTNSDLLWALKGGGGGNFGIVTSLTFALSPIPASVSYFKIAWGGSHGVAAIKWFQEYATHHAPPELGLQLMVARYWVTLIGLYLGPQQEALGYLTTALQQIGSPQKSEILEGPYLEAVAYFAADNMVSDSWGRADTSILMLNPWGLRVKRNFYKVTSLYADSALPPEGVATLGDWISHDPGPLDNWVSLHAYGGALDQGPGGSVSSFPHYSSLMAVQVSASWKDPAQGPRLMRWLRSLTRAVAPYLSPRAYVNYIDTDMSGPLGLAMFHGNALPGLISVKQKYDPTSLLALPGSVPNDSAPLKAAGILDASGQVTIAGSPLATFRAQTPGSINATARLAWVEQLWQGLDVEDEPGSTSSRYYADLYLAIVGGVFIMVALDVYGYVSIALYAAVYEYLWPTPGSPWYARRHRGKTLKPGSSKAPGKDHVSSPSKGKGTWREKWGAAAGGLTSRRSTGADQDKGTSLPVPSSSSSSSSSCSCASEWGVPTVTLAVSPERPGKGSLDVEAQHDPVVPEGVPPELVPLYTEYPTCMVQLPMYNEDVHCERVIRCACRIAWPRDKLLIQVNDDSTREDIKSRVDKTAAEMRELGHMVQVTRRVSREGFKAGNMVAGLDQIPPDFEPKYVAVFDADFAPPVDYLYQTIHHMEREPRLAFVQARWLFANAKENLLTRMQQTTMDAHFMVDQRARGFIRTFFGFNGTAGIWRKAAMDEAGGWHIDTTVEDMDLSTRAWACGWYFKYLHWVGVPSELPSTMAAYRSQQYRWNAGPMQVMKKCLVNTWKSDRIPLTSKLSVTYFFWRYVYALLGVIICVTMPIILIFVNNLFVADDGGLRPWTWRHYLFVISSNANNIMFMVLAPVTFPVLTLFCISTAILRFYANWCGLIGSEKSKGWKVTAKTGFDGAANSKGADSLLSPSKAGKGALGDGPDEGMMTPAKGGDKQLYLTEGSTKLRNRHDGTPHEAGPTPATQLLPSRFSRGAYDDTDTSSGLPTAERSPGREGGYSDEEHDDPRGLNKADAKHGRLAGTPLAALAARARQAAALLFSPSAPTQRQQQGSPGPYRSPGPGPTRMSPGPGLPPPRSMSVSPGPSGPPSALVSPGPGAGGAGQRAGGRGSTANPLARALLRKQLLSSPHHNDTMPFSRMGTVFTAAEAVSDDEDEDDDMAVGDAGVEEQPSSPRHTVFTIQVGAGVDSSQSTQGASSNGPAVDDSTTETPAASPALVNGHKTNGYEAVGGSTPDTAFTQSHTPSTGSTAMHVAIELPGMLGARRWMKVEGGEGDDVIGGRALDQAFSDVQIKGKWSGEGAGQDQDSGDDQKEGDDAEAAAAAAKVNLATSRSRRRIYMLEVVMAVYYVLLAGCAVWRKNYLTLAFTLLFGSSHMVLAFGDHIWHA